MLGEVSNKKDVSCLVRSATKKGLSCFVEVSNNSTSKETESRALSV